MPGRLLFVITLLIFTGILAGCSSGSCDEPTESMVNMTFRLTDAETNSSIDSITVFGIGMEEELIYDTVKTKQVSLPLYPDANSLQFVIRRGYRDDTLTIEYESEIRFISRECGYAFFYQVINIYNSYNWINNTIIINPDISPGDEENIRTFY